MALEKEEPFGYDDLNRFLAALRETGDLIEITEDVDPNFEIGAVLKLLGEREGPAALFPKVTGHPGKTIAGNVVGHRRRIALAFGVQEDELAAAYLERKNNRIPPVLVKEGPVKET
ncbi:MAG: UbiD family decarboxylase, partial [Betaproteobacteria bacterium]|nr:UbiD family decarboxylase [Betaproteobacteria bacterium]